MCDPKYFGVTYDINPWMSSNIGHVDHAVAIHQWTTLKNALSKVAKVNIMPGVQDLPDLVFTANAGTGIYYNNIVVISTFNKPERQPEEQHFIEWFSTNGYKTVQLIYSYEGEGDHLIDKWGRHWMGSGFRTDTQSAGILDDIFSLHINTLELVDSRWYHLDTCFAPMPNGELLWYPEAFSVSSQLQICNSFDNRIAISEQDALSFACNAVCIDNNIFIPKNNNVSTQLSKLGYIVQEFDLSEFIKAGGAAKCLVLDLGVI